ncbi:hypothetical protein NC99_33800 [Sunxiuqinia dokdonensis]|uniref:Uncharacterized protein n=1 Tax=Sunxiuqinia dokdonensis TaxID=1409788 RepID=A0A0L8V614_9BACT|nr:hypothetical protein NC99_33800 [Sunxiuqinia dokdonensis]
MWRSHTDSVIERTFLLKNYSRLRLEDPIEMLTFFGMTSA